MPLKIFHTADVHLGRTFERGYPEAVQRRLVEARLETLRAMVQTANHRACDLFVVAGDLFDSTRVGKKETVLPAAEALRAFQGTALVLPGNHDFIQAGDDLWRWFREATRDDRLLLLDGAQTYDLPGSDATVYAAPCTAKHSDTNAIGWMSQAPPATRRFRIGVAHGSVPTLSPDMEQHYYPMELKELAAAGVDLWLMGHTHVRVPDADSGADARIFFPAIPEPDSFRCAHAGHAWMITLNEDKSLHYESLRTGRYRFREMSRTLKTMADVDSLRAAVRDLGPECLLRLHLDGRVPSEIYEIRAALREELAASLLHLELDDSGLVREVTSQDIDREFASGSFPHRLLHELTKDPADALALQTAYGLLREARG